MISALLLDSGVLNPPVLDEPIEVVPALAPVIPGAAYPRLMSLTVLNETPFSALSIVIGLTPPVSVLVTGSTLATLLVIGSITRLLTMPCLPPWPWSKSPTLVTTTVVKLWQM
jgi:hypothetical protein